MTVALVAMTPETRAELGQPVAAAMWLVLGGRRQDELCQNTVAQEPMHVLELAVLELTWSESVCDSDPRYHVDLPRHRVRGVVAAALLCRPAFAAESRQRPDLC